MAQMKTPGVYVVEKNAFPNSVVEVATAVPAFIGYTEKAINADKSLLNTPWRINSLADFVSHFGSAYPIKFVVNKLNDAATNEVNVATIGGERFFVDDTEAKFLYLYNSVRLFYANGGGPCYIVSIGDYKLFEATGPAADHFYNGLEQLKKEQEPTIVLAPDAILLGEECYSTVYRRILLHCGYEMKNRFAILDTIKQPGSHTIDNFRSGIGTEFVDYGAAYYPWLKTIIVQPSEISVANIAKESDLKVENVNAADLNEIFIAICNKLNVLPPSGAIAGVYTMVDNTKGVWKAPANVSLSAVSAPLITLSQAEVEGFNVTESGKSINAIQGFSCQGVTVWGARTLGANSLDWRYINVRRTLIMIEESIRLATKAYVFEPNVANTWVTVKAMVTNFLTGVWQRGGLAGATVEDAFSVHIGLGETMTGDDILEGILRVTVLLAVSKPAEFIEVTFQQQMQKS